MYNNVKEVFGYEQYLDMLPYDLRSYICIIRLSAHTLHIQTGRYGRNRIPRSERYCIYCRSNDIEDEYHFIIKCQCFEDLRKKYIKKHYYKRPNMLKFIELLKSSDFDIVLNLAKYLKASFSLRLSLTHTT